MANTELLYSFVTLQPQKSDVRMVLQMQSQFHPKDDLDK